MSLICLSAHCCYNTNTAETGNIINQLTQIRLARMSAAVRPDSQQNDHRHPGFLCLLNAVADACHNIILLICRDICRRSIKLPQILLAWLQLDNTQRCIRCCPRKIFWFYHSSCCNTGYKCPMPVFILRWHNSQTILCSQCPVDLLWSIFSAIYKAFGALPVTNSLIPYGINLRCTVLIGKCLMPVVDSSINDTDHHTWTSQIQIRWSVKI